MRKWSMLVVALAALLFLAAPMRALGAGGNTAVKGAVFTTVNPDVDGAGKCQNGGPGADAGLVNCNIYDAKEYVWLSGGPEGNQPALSDGTYVFAVLEPGGQGGDANPNDGTPKNLSDLSPTTNTGAGDDWTHRVFSVENGEITYPAAGYPGGHDFDNAHTQSQYGKIRLMPYDNTPNPGGEYIMAVCNLADRDASAQNEPGVDPSDCKYDAFKVDNGTLAKDLVVSKTADTSYDRTYTWSIEKSADQTVIKQPASDATVVYTIVVKHDAGTPSNWKVTGTITVENPNSFDVGGVNVTDKIDNNGTCSVDNGANIIVPGNGSVELTYTCTYASAPNPTSGKNTATATWFEDDYKHVSGEASYDFDAATVKSIDECVSVVDDNATPGDASDDHDFGNVCVGAANPTTFTYSRTVSGTPGTCTTYDNTATFTTNDSGTTGSDDASVKLCVGADLTVSKTAAPFFTRTYTWVIAKSTDQPVIKQVGSTATVNYTVKVDQTGYTDSAWQVKGSITVSNPNDWQSVTLTDLSDAVDNGGSCTLDNPSQATAEIPASGSLNAAYTCTYAAAPNPASGTNTATASWDSSAAYTANNSAVGTKGFAFTTPTTTVNMKITVTDTFGGTTTTLGTLTAKDTTPYTTNTFTYARTVNVPVNTCTEYPNTATITETGQSASATVKVCGPVKGGLTMGFWQNPNGQTIIKNGASTTGVCNSGTWLRTYAPFQDLSATATCTQVATYVNNVIKAANASGAAMNAMLKGQMLATALDVYFSNTSIFGSNPPIKSYNGGYTNLGSVRVDLTKVCKNIASCTIYESVSDAFGGASSMTVSELLAYAASKSNSGGSTWYGQDKKIQELAKDVFDAINNQVAFSA